MMTKVIKDAAQVIAELTATNAELRDKIKELEKSLWRRDHPVLRRALSVSDVMRMKKETYPLKENGRKPSVIPRRMACGSCGATAVTERRASYCSFVRNSPASVVLHTTVWRKEPR